MKLNGFAEQLYGLICILINNSIEYVQKPPKRSIEYEQTINRDLNHFPMDAVNRLLNKSLDKI